MKRKRTTYSQDFKVKAVELGIQRGNLTNVAQELNLRIETLQRWKKAYKAGKLVPNGTNTRSKEEEELILLKKELYEIRLERDILKKAASIFSKSDR